MVLEKGRANTVEREEEEEDEEEEEEEEKRKEERRKGKRRSQVWNLSMGTDTWFRTLYLVYGLGFGTPKLISCRVELRKTPRLLFMCVRKGLAAS